VFWFDSEFVVFAFHENAVVAFSVFPVASAAVLLFVVSLVALKLNPEAAPPDVDVAEVVGHDEPAASDFFVSPLDAVVVPVFQEKALSVVDPLEPLFCGLEFVEKENDDAALPSFPNENAED